MPIGEAPERITHPDQENRCQASTALGQCQCVSVNNTKFCRIHGGANGAKKEAVRMYHLTKFRARAEDIEGHASFRTMAEELAVLRMVLQEVITKAEQDESLLMHSPLISSMVSNINQTLVAHTKLEAMIGKTINKEEAMAMMDQVLTIITKRVSDPDILQGIQEDLLKILQDAEAISRKRNTEDK